MKKIIILFLLFLSLSHSYAQMQFSSDFVKWNYDYEWISSTELVLKFHAKVSKPWHLYDANLPEGGPISTTITIDKNENVLSAGKVSTSIEPTTVFDEAFNMELRYFSNEVTFLQTVVVDKNIDFTVRGLIDFMICDDSKCLPPDVSNFEIPIKASVVKAKGAVEMVIENKPATTLDNTKKNVLDTATKLAISGTDSVGSIVDTVKQSVGSVFSPEINSKSNSSSSSSSLGLWIIFIAGFLGGLLALLTPCVFPMIPMTVSFFIKKDKGKGVKDAVIYGLSIVVIYLLLGLLVSIFWGPDALNALSTNPIFNVVFFLLLVVFAISFLGAFEIQLPTSWANYFDKKADSSTGVISILFMAFTLAIVSFSCTGPIIGTLLVEAAMTGSTIGPLMGMAGFAIALALPFTLFALFPSWLNSLPKSGGWLNSVKVVLGFLELALALKFLSTADLAAHWGILDRETFLVLWIVIFTLLGFYLLGKLKFAHDSDVKYISVPKLFLAIVSLSFALYMVPGLWGAPLKAISAFSPPQHTQDFDLYTFSLNVDAGHNTQRSNVTSKKFDDIFHCPLNLNCFFDYDEGLAFAKEVGKPVLLDFTGHGCVNCRNMEVKVWSDKQVLRILNNEYVLISLYVDDKLELPKEDQFEWKIGNRTMQVKTIGNKWSHFQATRFGANSQPYYVVLNSNGEQLLEPRGFDLGIDRYVEFLNLGIEKYKEANR